MRKYLMMLMAVAFIGMTALAQGERTEELSKKELRKQKREYRKQNYEIDKAYGINLIERRDFVLQADLLSGKNNMPISVSKQTNFIKIDGDDMVIQYGLNSQVGLNGVGGLTFHGKIRTIDMKDGGEGKAFNTRIQFSTPYLNGLATVQINIRGDKAEATLWSNGRRLNFEGAYVSNEESLITEAVTRGIFN